MSNQVLCDIAARLQTQYPPELVAIANYVDNFKEEMQEIIVDEQREHGATDDIRERELQDKERQARQLQRASHLTKLKEMLQ